MCTRGIGMFKWKWTRERLALLARCLVVVAGLISIVVWALWSEVAPWFKDNETALKAIGLLVSPILAVYGYIAATKDKIELREQGIKLGQQMQAAADATKRADAAEVAAKAQAATAQKLKAELEGITTGADQLWKLRPARPFSDYRQWYLEKGATVVTIGNLKGGVGKTTLAANYAAYLSETLHKNVLLLDLDYQGSLSSMLLEPLGRLAEESSVNKLFGSKAGLAEVLQARTHLVPDMDAINTRLSRAWLVPASYEYAALENQLLLSWLMDKDQDIDVRYRLAHVLLHPDVRREYDVIVIDLPPRLTIGAINALVASHYFFVPTVLDKISVEAVPQFLSNVKGIKQDLNLDLELAGIIGTLTQQNILSPNEEKQFGRAQEGAAVWSSNPGLVLPRTVPKRAAIATAAGEEIAYILANNQARLGVREILDPLFADMTARIKLGQS
jgi:cellulose biosynthesis protein BcsQ